MFHPSPRHHEGRSRDRHGTWRGLRWTLWRQTSLLVGRKRLQRTAKSCGPGAATLALRWREFLADNGGKKGRFPGESTKETVKPLRGESRDVSAVPVVQPVCFLCATFAHGTAGAVGARLSLRPLSERDD